MLINVYMYNNWYNKEIKNINNGYKICKKKLFNDLNFNIDYIILIFYQGPIV